MRRIDKTDQIKICFNAMYLLCTLFTRDETFETVSSPDNVVKSTKVIAFNKNNGSSILHAGGNGSS